MRGIPGVANAFVHLTIPGAKGMSTSVEWAERHAASSRDFMWKDEIFFHEARSHRCSPLRSYCVALAMCTRNCATVLNTRMCAGVRGRRADADGIRHHGRAAQRDHGRREQRVHPSGGHQEVALLGHGGAAAAGQRGRGHRRPAAAAARAAPLASRRPRQHPRRRANLRHTGLEHERHGPAQPEGARAQQRAAAAPRDTVVPRSAASCGHARICVLRAAARRAARRGRSGNVRRGG